jgi:hypothetical protein
MKRPATMRNFLCSGCDFLRAGSASIGGPALLRTAPRLPRHDPPSHWEAGAPVREGGLRAPVAPGLNPEVMPEPAKMLEIHRITVVHGSRSATPGVGEPIDREMHGNAAWGEPRGAKWGWWGEVGRVGGRGRVAGAMDGGGEPIARRLAPRRVRPWDDGVCGERAAWRAGARAASRNAIPCPGPRSSCRRAGGAHPRRHAFAGARAAHCGSFGENGNDHRKPHLP